MAQEVDQLSASDTAIRFLPMGAGGFITSLICGRAVEKVNGKILLLVGMGLSVLAPVPSCLTADKLNLYVTLPLSSILDALMLTFQLDKCSPYLPDQRDRCLDRIHHCQHDNVVWRPD